MRIAWVLACAAITACRTTGGATSPPEVEAAARPQARADAIDRRVADLVPEVTVEGEDATSGSWTFVWSERDGEVLKSRTVWNGGCCSTPEIRDTYYEKGAAFRDVEFVAPRAELERLLAGREPRTRGETTERPVDAALAR